MFSFTHIWDPDNERWLNGACADNLLVAWCHDNVTNLRDDSRFQRVGVEHLSGDKRWLGCRHMVHGRYLCVRYGYCQTIYDAAFQNLRIKTLCKVWSEAWNKIHRGLVNIDIVLYITYSNVYLQWNCFILFQVSHRISKTIPLSHIETTM